MHQFNITVEPPALKNLIRRMLEYAAHNLSINWSEEWSAGPSVFRVWSDDRRALENTHTALRDTLSEMEKREQ